MKPLEWVGSSLDDLREFPREARQEAGYAIHLAQTGGKAANAIPLAGFGGAKVLEVIIDARGDTYRTVYTVAFPRAVYVLHAFQKKSRKGIATPKREIELVRSRLATAAAHHEATYDRRPVGKGDI